MAQLRGDSKVGGKPIVTLDVMDNFVDQILGVSLESKISKCEDTRLNTVNDINALATDESKNGVWPVSSVELEKLYGMYSSGTLTNFKTPTGNFQLYAPAVEGSKLENSALYFRTGGGEQFYKWKKVAGIDDVTTLVGKKFDKSGGTITGPTTFENSIETEGCISYGLINWFKYGMQLGVDRNFAIAGGDNLTFFSSQAEMEMQKDTLRYNDFSMWHSGNFNPNDYVSRETTLLTQGTDLNTIKTTGYYRCNAAVNRPSKITGWAYIEVVRHDNNYVLQKIYSYDGNHIYSRTLNAGAWTGWKPLGGGLSYSQNITAGNWTVNGDLYEMTVTHNIGSENITSVIVTDSNKISMFTGFQVISSTSIKVFSATNPAGKIVINATL